MTAFVATVAATAFLLMPTANATYTAERTQRDGIPVVRLADTARKTAVTIVPSIGNNAFEMLVNGKNILHFPFATLADFKAKPGLAAVPFLAPWANRLDEDGFWANGKHYALDRGLKNIRADGNNKPIHGLLSFASEWEVVDVKADASGAEVTSRLEFWRYPDYMAQFPFAHTISMTYRLEAGVLEVKTVLENHATVPMPVSVGFHPYFKISDAPRDQWTVRLPAKEQVLLSKELIPTGETKPNGYADNLKLQGVALDDVFSGLIRGESGRSEFSVTGTKQRISVLYGKEYPVAVVYAPAGRDFICFEPMSGPTNAFNLNHAGKYPDLQTVAPRGKWEGSFWIRAEGFDQ
ncbi:MAG: aldose 1-epimerase [Bryobacteraceae bacterium]|nr:aldose 1-epimerase [Bryobacteraceae bacterium]